MSEAVNSWDEIADWWIQETEEDPVYREDIGPMYDELVLGHEEPVLDLGCGEGQWLRRLRRESGVFGVDGSLRLLMAASSSAPVVQGRVPFIQWVRTGSVETAVSVFVLDLIENHRLFFDEVARAVAPGGLLVVIINHPAFTAPGSGPFVDSDFDVFWRWGEYLTPGKSVVPAGGEEVAMYHRSLGTLLTAAAAAGWGLERVIESSLGPGAIAREPAYAGQEGIPRFLGVRWRR